MSRQAMKGRIYKSMERHIIMKLTLRYFLCLAVMLLIAGNASATRVYFSPTDPSLYSLTDDWGAGYIAFTATNGTPGCTSGNADPVTCGTLPPAHGGQTVGWGYAVQNTTSYWFLSTGVDAVDNPGTMLSHSFTYSNPNSGVFTYWVFAPNTDEVVQYSPSGGGGGAGLFEIAWHTGLQYNTHEAGFFVLSGSFFDADPNLTGLWKGDTVAGVINAPFDASAPEPMSLVLLTTAFGLAYWVRKRRAA
jgi:hypothetical protein